MPMVIPAPRYWNIWSTNSAIGGNDCCDRGLGREKTTPAPWIARFYQSPRTPGRDTQVFDSTCLRNHGRKYKIVPGVFIDDHGGLAFDFHLLRRDPTSAFECWQNHLPHLV